MKRIKINASKQYEVIISSGILLDAAKYVQEVAKGKNAVIVSDDNVFALYGNTLKQSLEKCGYNVLEFVFAHGEQSKNINVYKQLLDKMYKNRITRADSIIALGGGVVGDLAGFAAATYQRGIGFIQVPTTLLAAVDSSVGGKTAIDLEGGKNQVGAFYQPDLVLCDVDTLKTLAPEQYACGAAEVIKYSILFSEKMFNSLMKKPLCEQEEEIIEQCVCQKRDIVQKDEFDTGERMLLNLGHTFGHAIETCSNFEILHGQAVAMGMEIIAKSAFEQGYCNEETLNGVLQILQKYNLQQKTNFSAKQMINEILADKKATGSEINLIVPVKIGKCDIVKVKNQDIEKWLAYGGIK